MDKCAVIVAGGSGLRMGISLPKQFLILRNKPVLWYTLTAFLNAYPDMQIILVLPEQHLETGRSIIHSTIDPDRILMTIGGDTRFHSVQKGLQHIHHHCMVFVHDGVRCLILTELIHRCYEQGLIKGNAIPAITAVDTIRITTEDGNHLMDRERVKIIQTPQTFQSDIIKPAYEQQFKNEFTDEASVVETMGIKINLIEGDADNIKITRPIDLLIAEKLLKERELGL
jgi:2-C-methyl-D-erythritol 4-phosphate cytidylyltransferase